MTISHADAGYRTRVVAVRGECVNTGPARQPRVAIDLLYSFHLFITYVKWCVLVTKKCLHVRYRSKIETVRVQASPSGSYCAVKELDCKEFHKLALKASMNRLKYH